MLTGLLIVCFKRVPGPLSPPCHMEEERSIARQNERGRGVTLSLFAAPAMLQYTWPVILCFKMATALLFYLPLCCLGRANSCFPRIPPHPSYGCCCCVSMAKECLCIKTWLNIKRSQRTSQALKSPCFRCFGVYDYFPPLCVHPCVYAPRRTSAPSQQLRLCTYAHRATCLCQSRSCPSPPTMDAPATAVVRSPALQFARTFPPVLFSTHLYACCSLPGCCPTAG